MGRQEAAPTRTSRPKAKESLTNAAGSTRTESVSTGPKSHKDMVAAMFRTVFSQPDAGAAADAWDTIRDQLAATIPRIGPLMDEAKIEVLGLHRLPRAAGCVNPDWPSWAGQIPVNVAIWWVAD